MALEVQDEASSTRNAPMSAQLRTSPSASGSDAHHGSSVSGVKNSTEVHVQEGSSLLQGLNDARTDYGTLDSRNDYTERSETERSCRKASIFWILPFLFIYMLGFGSMIVPKINLVISLICRDYHAQNTSNNPLFNLAKNSSQCQIPEVQSRVARFQLYMNLVGGILSALVSPRLGHLSDRYGRTRIMAWNTLAAAIGETFTILVATMPERMPVSLLLLQPFFDGLGGSYTVAMAVVTSYVSDCTPPEKRMVAFGFIHGVLFTGIAAGPTLSAILLKQTGHVVYVFYIGLALLIFVLAAILLVVPESLSKERQLTAREKHEMTHSPSESVSWISRLNPMNLISPLAILMPPVGRPSILFPNREGASPALRRNIILLAVIDTVIFGVGMGVSQIIIIYSEYMFGWGNVESSIFVSMISTTRMACLFLVLPIVNRIFREPPRSNLAIPGASRLDVSLIRLSVILHLIGYSGYAMSKDGTAMTVSGMIAALGGIGTAILQSSITKHVTRDRIGQILGALGLLHALCRIAAPTALTLLYSATVGKATQAIFVFLAIGFGLTLLSSFFIRPHVSIDEISPNESDVEADDYDGVEDTLLQA